MPMVGYSNLSEYKYRNPFAGLFGKHSKRRFARSTFWVRFFDVAEVIGGSIDFKKYGLFSVMPEILYQIANRSGKAYISILSSEKLSPIVKALLFLPVALPLFVISLATSITATLMRLAFGIIGYATALVLSLPVLAPISIGAVIYRKKTNLPELTYKATYNDTFVDDREYEATRSDSAAGLLSPSSSDYEPPAVPAKKTDGNGDLSLEEIEVLDEGADSHSFGKN